MVQGGQQPVTGATIQLYAVGTTGYGSTPTPLIGATFTTSDGTGVVNGNANAGNANNTLAAGDFTITGAYTCPTASTLVYLVATGGNPGLTAGTNNSAIVLLSALGQCGSLTSSTFVSINEVTTVASIYALSQFASSSGNIGSVSATTAGIVNAFANVDNMVDIATGAALTTTTNGNTVPQAEIDTIADILVPCVNSAGPTSTACATLFSAATPSGGTAPTTVVGAVLDIVLNPGNNVPSLFTISTANTAFQPTLSSAPSNWTVYQGGATTNCGYSGLGYTVSGTVNYLGTQTGQIYLALGNTSCGGGGTQGTSISAKGTYTIQGVPPGTYVLQAFMDTQGYGATNAADPTGSASVTVSSSNVGSQDLTLGDPATVTLPSAPSLQSVDPFNTGAAAFFNAIKSNGTEAATSYTLQWSTNSSFTPIAGSQTFPAIGTHSNICLVNGLTDGSVYYFRLYGTSAGTPVSPYSSTYGPITIGAPATGSSVSGAVTTTGTATGPMYVGLYNQYTGAAYAEYIAHPVSMQGYTVVVPNSATAVYEPFAIVDQNNDGAVDAGDIQNVDNNGAGSLIPITGTTANVNFTVPAGNSIAAVQTTHYQSGTPVYNISLSLFAGTRLPVSVTLLSSSNSDGANVAGPSDIALCGQSASSCGNGFRIGYNLAASSAPAVGDTYFFFVKYSDGSTETVSAAVTGVLSDFATGLATTGTNTTPTFTWTAPVCGACSTYVYTFNLAPANGNNIWQVPGNANGLPYSTTSLAWGVDPTDSGNTPSVGSLTSGTNYSWTIGVVDSNGNQADTQANYTP